MSEHSLSRLRQAFDGARGEAVDAYAEIPCFVNGEPARAIVRPNRVGSHLELELLWVSVTPGMVVVDLRGNRAA